MSFSLKGEGNKEFPEALPFHSVDTIEEAQGIRVTHCRHQYDGTYVINEWRGEVEDIFTLAEKLELS